MGTRVRLARYVALKRTQNILTYHLYHLLAREAAHKGPIFVMLAVFFVQPVHLFSGGVKELKVSVRALRDGW